MEVGLSGEPAIFVKLRIRKQASSLIDRMDTVLLPESSIESES